MLLALRLRIFQAHLFLLFCEKSKYEPMKPHTPLFVLRPWGSFTKGNFSFILLLSMSSLAQLGFIM
jgi:hypothetical protein